MKKSTIKTIAAFACVTAVGVAPVFASVATNFVVSPTVSPTVSYEMGDVNRDGKVNLKDAKLVLGNALGIQKPEYVFDDEQKSLCDFEKDGKINLKDAKLQLKASLGIKF